jgi:hypothetical protein
LKKMRNAVGFYWTLPVPWAGFETLPADIDAAARASQTIRYQRALIRRHAKAEKYDLIREEVFLEIEPDRGSRDIRDPLNRLAKYCRKQNAMLLYVDFTEAGGWRSHNALKQWAAGVDIEVRPVAADPVLLEGEKLFDPGAHFSAWRARQAAWQAAKPARARIARSRIADLTAQGMSNPAIAMQLNAEEVRSLTGKPWTGEMVRKVGAGA